MKKKIPSARNILVYAPLIAKDDDNISNWMDARASPPNDKLVTIIIANAVITVLRGDRR